MNLNQNLAPNDKRREQLITLQVAVLMEAIFRSLGAEQAGGSERRAPGRKEPGIPASALALGGALVLHPDEESQC